MIRDMYITITVVRKNYEEAKNFFTRVGAELNMHLSRLGFPLYRTVRRRPPAVLHGFYRHGEEADFHFDLAETARKGHSFKDYICPDSMERTRITLCWAGAMGACCF